MMYLVQMLRHHLRDLESHLRKCNILWLRFERIKAKRRMNTNLLIHWFPFKITSEQLVQNSHTDDASQPRSSDWLKICLMHLEALTRSGQCCVMSMEFLPYSSDVILQGTETSACWCCKMSAVFSR